VMQNLSYNSIDPSDEPEHSAAGEAEDVKLASCGDEAAFTRLFHHYNAPICVYLACLVGNAEVGGDLAQETFIRAWKNLPTLVDEVHFKSWLYRIATNLAHSHTRRERLVRWLPWHEQSSRDALPSAWVEGPEMQTGEAEYVRQVLAQLGPQVRSCLLLQLYGGFSQREIATALNISEKSVSAYVSRGREQFRRLYRQIRGDISQ
jgi:RNA polymerase sigma-70 factor (ECF subfamily)